MAAGWQNASLLVTSVMADRAWRLGGPPSFKLTAANL